MKLKYLLFFCISAQAILSITATDPASPADSSLAAQPKETGMSINFRKLPGEDGEEGEGEGQGEGEVAETTNPDGGGDAPASFNQEAEESELSAALILEVPKAFSCEDVEKVITCKDNVKPYLTFRIKYKATAVGSGGPQKKIIYTVTVSNGLTEGQDFREFHGTYRVKFEKDPKGINLKQKMGWIFGSSASNDLNRPNFVNDLRRLAPIYMDQVRTHTLVNELIKKLFSGPTIHQGDKSLYVRGPCLGNPQVTCTLTLYPVSLFDMRAQVQVGRAASNFAIPLSDFGQVFPGYVKAILQFSEMELRDSMKGDAKAGYPLNQQMAKAYLVNGLKAASPGCTLGSEIDQRDGNFNLFALPFTFSRQLPDKQVDEKYTMVGVYYNFEGWNYEHLLLDSDKQQEEILLNTNNQSFLTTFKEEVIEFFYSNDYSKVATQGEFTLTLEDCKKKLGELSSPCVVDENPDQQTSVFVKCRGVDVLAVHEITGENDSGFRVDFLLIVPGKNIPESGFVLQKVNSFDQFERVKASIQAYIARANAYVGSLWALV